LSKRYENSMQGESGIKQGSISALKYLMNNKKRICLLVFTFGLFIAVVYSFDILVIAGFSPFRGFILSPGEKFQIVSFYPSEMKSLNEDEAARLIEEVRYALLQLPNVEQTIMSDIMCFDVNSVIGIVGMGAVFLTDKDNIEDFLNYTGAQLVSSDMSMPQNPGEILISEVFARNIRKDVNDTISAFEGRTYRIVGIIQYKTDEPCYLSVGIKYDEFYTGIVLFANGKKTVNSKTQAIDYTDVIMNNLTLKDYMSKGLIEYVVDFTTREKTFENYHDFIIRALTLIKTISTITVFISLLTIFNLYMKERYSEWCLYNSIGYSSKDIYLLIVRELLIILGCSILAAISCFLGIYVIIYVLVFDPFCLRSDMYSRSGMLECLAIFVMFFGLLQASVFYATQSITTVDAIDESFI